MSNVEDTNNSSDLSEFFSALSKEKKESPKDESKEKNETKDKSKKYTFDEQLEILVNYYKEVDPKKTESDIETIINNRRPKGNPKGSRIPTKQWLELCDKLKEKYK